MPQLAPDQTILQSPDQIRQEAWGVEQLLAIDHLPTPPAVAMQVVREASNPDITSARISDILRRDPALCARVLKAINSVVYGMREQVTSIDRAVLLLGLNSVRGIVLALSLPAMQSSGRSDKSFRDFWQTAVSGAVIARELAVKLKVPTADDDMLVGLMRDIGDLLIQQQMPTEYAMYARGRADRPYSQLCEHERQVFGFDHAEVSGELLQRWHLPDALVQPIRHHHNPQALSGGSPAFRERCERLGFVDALTHLDLVAQHPDELDALLNVAKTRYGLDHTGLVKFLEGVVPQVEAFTVLLNVDVGQSPNYAATLARGSSELYMLTVESGAMSVSATVRTPSGPSPSLTTTPRPGGRRLPEFRLEFLDEFPAGGCVLEGHELKRVLGRGAMGVVFEGFDLALNRPVAVKMMLPELAEHDRYRQRFIREARSVAAIRDENVVAIHAVKDNGPYTYLCMELVDGVPLADRLERPPPLTVDELVALAVQVTRGLRAAHARKIVHRDVKPENILLDRGSGQAKLTDFGLAQVEETDLKLTTDGGLVGTPLYMSPEQATCRPLGPRSDLFSLGAVLYTAATGTSPFDDRTMFGVLKKVCEQHPVPPSRLRPDLPPWFDAAILRLLSKREDDRYQSADELLTVLLNPPPPASPAKRKRWWMFGLA